MRKLNKLVAILMLATITLFSACTEKEVPVPTVDTERLDALRLQLRELQMRVYGEEEDAEEAKANQTNYENEIAWYEAEIERLKNAYARTVTYGITITDFQNNKLAGVTVTLAQEGELASSTTDENGYVGFENIHSGVVNVVVEGEGYTTANYKSSIYDGFSQDDAATYAATRLALFPATGNTDGMFTLKGSLYANYSMLNDTLDNYRGNGTAPGEGGDKVDYDAVEGKKLRFVLELSDIKDETDAISSDIYSLIYENAFYEATTAADGSYTVSLPARSIFEDTNGGVDSKNFAFSVSGEDFKGNFTYVNRNDTITTEVIYEISPEGVNEDGEAIMPGENRARNFFYNWAVKN
jgi:hypothetical protein